MNAVKVGTARQFFLDQRWFDCQQGMSLTVNPPVKAGQVLLPEMPWEKQFVQMGTVMEDEGIYKMWYHAFGLPGCPEGHGHCYATSTDGLHWERPDLDVIHLPYVPHNNMVMPGASGVIMKDPNGADEHRYKALLVIGENPIWPESKGCDDIGIYLATSPDGIRWKKQMPEALPFQHDTENQFFYDRRLGRYVAYVRWYCPFGRAVARLEFGDPMQLPWPFREKPNWKPLGRAGRHQERDQLDIVMHTDGGRIDPPETDFYNSCVVQLADDCYLSFPSVFRNYPPPEKGGLRRGDGPIEIQMAVSRDGVHWSRPDRRPYVPLGLAGEWDGGCLYMHVGMIARGNEIWQYYTGVNHTHGDYAMDGKTLGSRSIGRLVQRQDGFISADADYTGGCFTTPVLTFSGGCLKLNIDCSAMGEARVEIQDPEGIPVRGFSLENSIPIDRNHIAVPVIWKGPERLSELVGRPVRLHFKLRACKLYTFQFADS